jgi:hypothetical protein
MPGTARWWVAASIALLGPPAAAADPASAAPAATPRYPFDVALEVPAQVRRASYLYVGTGGLVAPPDPGVAIPIGEQARQAYEALQRRTFRRGDPEAELELHGVEGELDYDADGWSVKIVHVLVLRAPGKTIGRWTVKGRARIAGLGHAAMPAAFERAADEAARAFERRFEEPEGVVDWMATRGVAPRPLPPPAPAATAPASPAGALAPPRGSALYLTGAAGVYLLDSGGAGNTSSGFGPNPALALRAGLTAPRFFAQLAAGSTVIGDKERFRASTRGLDAGVNARLTPDVEVAAGFGYASLSYSTYGPGTLYGRPRSRSTWMPSIVGALHGTMPVTASGTRYRMGVELRRDLGEASLQEYSGSWTRLAPAFSAWVLLGIESPPL